MLRSFYRLSTITRLYSQISSPFSTHNVTEELLRKEIPEIQNRVNALCEEKKFTEALQVNEILLSKQAKLKESSAMLREQFSTLQKTFEIMNITGMYKKLMPVFKNMDDIAIKLSKEDPFFLAKTRSLLSDQYRLEQNTQKALKCSGEAIYYLKQMPVNFYQLMAAIYFSAGISLECDRKNKDAISWYSRIIEHTPLLHATERLGKITYQRLLGLLKAENDTARMNYFSGRMQKDMLEISGTHVLEHDEYQTYMDSAQMGNTANTLFGQGDYQGAFDMYKSIFDKFPAKSRMRLSLGDSMTNALYYLGKIDEGIKLREEIIAEGKKYQDKNDLYFKFLYLSLGHWNKKQKNWIKAIDAFKEYIQYEKRTMTSDFEIGIVLNYIAFCYYKMGDLTNTEKYAEKAIQIFSGHPGLATGVCYFRSYEILTAAAIKQGDEKKIMETLKKWEEKGEKLGEKTGVPGNIRASIAKIGLEIYATNFDIEE